ncbi:hypothetical protein GSI_07315 [Ganoderma sinense ZZ0214-1]|uniref:Uncharacterized protein n=1 Tax=Ganoderma sinense ZZ0214-1 TaxID=1077348 RepID=A0A2G8SA39_9APHY|nr:hypothetical protein GSI_07315 [Ganoderma sinense ZZ0214-1]
MAAWPTHKHVCGSKSREDAAVLGYPSTVSLARALNTWVAMHTWSLETIAEASAHCGQGVDFSLENQLAIVFVVLSRDRAPGAPSNPAEAFMLEQASLVSKDDRPFLAAHWPRLERTCKALGDDMRATLSLTERHAFAGFIPAAFHFRATGMVAFHQYPLFRLRAHGCGPSYEHPFVTEQDALFGDVAKIWGLLINHGLVLRPHHTKHGGPLLQAGRCMQFGKSWAWLPAEVEWEAEGDASAGGASRGNSGLPPTPTELYQRYHKLLGQRNFE